jgi:hypothetical protein
MYMKMEDIPQQGASGFSTSPQGAGNTSKSWDGEVNQGQGLFSTKKPASKTTQSHSGGNK